MRKRKKKLKLKRIFLLLIIAFLFYFFINYDTIFKTYLCNNPFFSKIQNTSRYPIIYETQNTNYAGIGQKEIPDKDGYFTTFTTEENHQKTYLEYKQNGISSWSNQPYWGGTMSENGCGITALAIILSGYKKDVTPEHLRKDRKSVV